MFGGGSDWRMALRLLARQPGSAAAIVLTLALGIGIVTSVYAVFNHVMFRPIPGVQDDGRLVTLLFHPPGKLDHLGSGSEQALPLLRQAATLESVASKWETRLPVATAANGDPEIRYVQFVTSRFFEVLGIRSRHGRLFSNEEAESTATIALVSDSFWARELGADRAALGRSLMVNGQPFTIVGIVERFRGWDASRVGQVDVWLPMGVQQMAMKASSADRTLSDVIARRRADATVEAVSAEAQRIYAAASESFDTFTRQFAPVAYAGLYSFGEDRFRVQIMRSFPFLMGGAVLLLLVACANTANLLLARMRRRTRELALQAALGATRVRLVRGLLAEALLLAAMASAAGVAIAIGIMRTLRGLRIFAFVPEVVDLAIDVRVAVFAIAVAAATVLIFGLLPSVRASRADVRTLLPSTSLATPRSRRIRMALVAAQLAISLTLLGAAGVLTRSLANLRSQDVGMRTHDVVSFSINPRLIGFNAARRDQLVRDLLARLESTPGVDAVAWASPPAFWGSGRTVRGIRLDAAVPHPEVESETMTVSGSYFGALGIALIEGRTFRPEEFQQPSRKSGGPAIVSAALARALFGERPAVGRTIVRGSWRAPTSAVMSIGDSRRGEFVAERELEIVGVAANTRTGWSHRRGPSQLLYEPGSQQLVYGSFYLRSGRPAAEVTSMARRVVRDLEPGLPVTDAGTVQQEIERLIPEERLFARVMAMVALLALLLGVAGTYAVMAYTVSERTREFGIRTALGAAPADIARGVIARAALMCLIGTAAGLGMFAFASRVLTSRLYGVSALDPASLAGGVVILLTATLVAAWLPARRATQVDPTITLRTD